MHFQNLEVRCDWSTRLAARFSRRSLGRKDCVTSQKNVCVGGYTYVTGLQSTLQCKHRHYANNLQACKSWALRDCHATSPEENIWLTGRHKRSSFWCHFGFAGIPRFLALTTTLRAFASTMTAAERLIRVVKTTDMLNSKLNQVINSLRLMAGAFSGWQARFTEYAQDQTCNFNLQQEFLSIYTMEVNKALTALLRLTEINDLLRQLAHLPRRNLISFADLPRFLTAELSILAFF